MKRLNSPVLNFFGRHTTQLLLVGIILIAIFMRFYQLDSLPPGLHPDEAANGLDVFRILEQNDHRPLYNTNGPRESLFFYLQAIFVAILGNTILALRIAPAVIGVLAVWVTYLWAKEWFGGRIALISAFLIAVTPWAVGFSRNGFRAGMVPLMIPLTLWLYTKGVKTGKHLWWWLAGLSLGAGMYTYLAFRLFPVAMLLMLIGCLIWNRGLFKHFKKQILISLVAFALAMTPMIIFGIKHPGDVFARATGTSFLNPDLNNGKPVQTLISTVGKTALMFNLRGDENYRHNLGGEPMLNVFVGLMFLIGLVICFGQIKRSKYLALLAVLFAMLLPEVLTAEGIPHALRAVGVMPTIFIISALGINYMLTRWYVTFPINSAARTSGLMAIVFLLGLTAFQGYTQYFVAWAQDPSTHEAYSEDAVAVGNFLVKEGKGTKNFVLIDGYSDKTVEYITHNKTSYQRIDANQISSIPTDGTKKLFVISKGQKDQTVKQLRERFAGGKLSPYYSAFNEDEMFFAYEVTK